MEIDILHSLVLSLSPAEKAEFKKFIRFNSGKRKPVYESLYDIYSKLSKQHLSPQAFQIKLAKYIHKAPSIKNNLANIRMQMKERLLQSLVIGQAAKNSKQMLKNLISEIELLINRKLYIEASLKLRQGKKHASSFDLNNLMAEIIDFEIFLLSKGSSKNDIEGLAKLVEAQNQYSSWHDLEIKIKNLFCKLTLMAEKDIQMAKATSKAELTVLVKNLNLLEIEIDVHKKQNNVHIVMWYYRIQNLYFRSIGEQEAALQYSAALIDFFESDQDRIKKFEVEYIKALCSYTRICFQYFKTAALIQSIEKVQQIYIKKKNFSALETTCDMGILCYLQNYEYDKAIQISEIMAKAWLDLTLKIEDGKLLWYAHTNVILHWVCANTISFNSWLNRGLSIARSNKGRAYYFGLRMLALIADLDNHQLFAFKEKLEAFQKTLQNNEHLTNFEKIVLRHFRTFYNIEFSNKNINLKQTEKDDLIQQNYKSLKAALLNLKFENPPINYGEVMLWCESHLQNKTIKQVFEAEANKN